MLLWFSASVVRELSAIALELEGIRLAQERIATALEQSPPREVASVAWTVGQPEEETNA